MVTQLSQHNDGPEPEPESESESAAPAAGAPGAPGVPSTRSSPVRLQPPSPPERAADALAPLLQVLLGTTLPVRFEFWDGSGVGPVDGIGTLRVESPDAVRRILWAPG